MKVLPKSVLVVVLCAVGFNVWGEQSKAIHQLDKSQSTASTVWDLSDLYASNERWETAFADIQTRIRALLRLKVDFGKSANALADSMHEISGVRKDVIRLYIYANMTNDEDQRISENQARLAKSLGLTTEFVEAIAWVDPELVVMGEQKLQNFLTQEPTLDDFDHYIDDVIRTAPHLLNAKGEALLANAGALTAAPNSIYELLVNVDIPWRDIELADGRKVLLNQSGFSKLRSAPNRGDRKAVFDQFFGVWKDYEASIGGLLNAEVQANIFEAKARNYDSVLDWQLADENLPEQVYRTLVRQVNENLPSLHRYFKLRGRILGIEKMRYYDLYPPLVEMQTSFGLDESKKITLQALKPLGKEYNDYLAMALGSNWVHIYPQAGKRSGAYMNGSAYDVHPYVLLNHNDDYNSLSTYIHEWGHAVHTMLAKQEQPFYKAGYSTFTSELASTINEILLEEYLIANAKTKDEKLFFLGQALESIRGTFFRQTMFAEFELAIHEAAQAGQPLTGTIFSEKYDELLKRYHDHDGKTVLIDEPYNREWMSVPHFYYDLYVFQYATSISGAAWFSERLLKGDAVVRDDFLNVLKAGGSDYAYAILKKAGLDMASAEPYEAIIRRMEDIMDRIEALLAA
ncbi:MAG: oligoendopeptidase F [Candidatus Azotimanducaceae bacterium]|jgi:oligoendopeptidase F